ncbi:MAG TPA: helix-turn-helix domain-containing protein, partial [Stellaceae bacterium]|nr:helix-turn-helix domain-containing protein [Stellaceae bacterium]
MRQRRKALGLDLANVAAALRIKPAYLMALEAGCFEELPAAVYAIGFIRAYADYLGLESSEMLRLFKQQSSLLAAKPD